MAVEGVGMVAASLLCLPPCHHRDLVIDNLAGDQANHMTVTCEKRIRRTTSHFLNGTHEFSELILTRMALLMDQSCSVLPLRSPKVRTFPFKLARTSL